MKGKWKTVLKVFATIMAAVIILNLLQRLLMPKYAANVIEGAFIAEYYEEEDKNHDVIFVGDCEVYGNFSPVTLWQEYGINSYIRGSADQYIWQSYYLLEDTLRYNTPEVVIFNVLSLKTNEQGEEAYNRMTLEGMEWSKTKVDAIKASMGEDEHFIEYVFPILRYHSRWTELSADDFKYMFKTPKVSHNGYLLRVDVNPAADRLPAARPLADYKFGDNAVSYLDKMRELCEERGIKLLLIKAPSLYPHWYEEWDLQVEEYANKYNLDYINFLDYTEEIGLDYKVDTYDAGLHLNLSGTEKLTRYLGKTLSEKYGLKDRRDEEKLSNIWEEKIKFYNEEIVRQKKEYGISEE